MRLNEYILLSAIIASLITMFLLGFAGGSLSATKECKLLIYKHVVPAVSEQAIEQTVKKVLGIKGD